MMLRTVSLSFVTLFCLTHFSFAQASHEIIVLAKYAKDGWHYLYEDGEKILDQHGEILKVEDEVFHFSEGLLMRSEKDAWGFVDINGKWIVAPLYESVKDFRNGYARVKNRKWGYIDATGKAITPGIFTRVYDFSEGMAAVKTDSFWGYIDTSGTMIIQPSYTSVGFFSNGLAPVERTANSTTKRWFMINTKGSEVVIAKMEGISYLGRYAEGRIRAREQLVKGGHAWIYLNDQGIIAIDKFFKNAEDFSEEWLE